MAVAESVVKEIGRRYEMVRRHLNERQRRIWAGVEAKSIGHGGLRATAIATGMSVSTVKAGVVELEQPEEHLQEPATERQRRPGAGRPPVTETQPAVGEALDALVEPVTRGEPTSPLRWTAKSAEKLAAELKNQGFSISPDTVERLLRAQGYSLQSTRKRFEGKENLDRDAQFDYIAKTCQSHIDQDLPAVSIDTKAKN